MRTYKYQQGSDELTVTIDEKAGTIAKISSTAGNITLPDGCTNEMFAAIAMATYETLNNEVHDEESDVITYENKHTQWNEYSLNFNAVNK